MLLACIPCVTAQLTSPVHRRASSASQQRLKTAKDISHPFECFPAKKTKNLCCFCVIFVLLHYEQHLTVSWCLGIFPSVHECAFLFSYSNLSSKWEPQSRCALQQGWFTPMQPMDSSAALHTTHVTQNLVFFSISRQNRSQTDTDSDNTINQIFLQKYPSLMVFNGTQTVSCPIRGAAQCTPHLPISAFKDSRNCSHSHFMDKQTK